MSPNLVVTVGLEQSRSCRWVESEPLSGFRRPQPCLKRKKYTGGCHCGKVRFEFTSDLGSAISCNCSICAKKGYVLAFVPAHQFTLLSGESNLSDYQFNRKMIHHLFCSTCGVGSFGRGKSPKGEMCAVNLRCVDDLDLSTVQISPVDGRSM